MTTVCIGDSIVNGYPFERNSAWVSLLGERNPAEDYLNKGIDGQMTEEILWRFLRDTAGSQRIIISAGTNDFIFSELSPQQVLQNINSMVLLTTQQVVLLIPILTIPEMAQRFWMDGTDYLEVNQKLGSLQRLMRKEYMSKNHTREEYGQDNATGLRVSCIDMQEAYKKWCASVGTKRAYVDGIHPTKEGYHEMARIVAQAFA